MFIADLSDEGVAPSKCPQSFQMTVLKPHLVNTLSRARNPDAKRWRGCMNWRKIKFARMRQVVVNGKEFENDNE